MAANGQIGVPSELVGPVPVFGRLVTPPVVLVAVGSGLV